MDKKTVGKRLREARLKKDLDILEVADMLNVSKSTVSMWENGHRTPDIFMLLQLTDILGIGINELIGREVKGEIDFNYINADMMRIPIIGEVKAGYDLLAEQNIIGYSVVAKTDLNGGEYFYLKVLGDSMTGADIHEGDLLLVRRQPAVDEGQIAVVLLENSEVTVKRVYYKGNQVILQSENPSYPPKLVSFENIKIQGLVKEIKRKVK